MEQRREGKQTRKKKRGREESECEERRERKQKKKKSCPIFLRCSDGRSLVS